ncbi:MAG: tRNA (adenosine(37)-N6)-dimethylallyltransferase MiaA, partial [Clostridiales Family XIII bacterium]|nr:tRNA (adenosine(37)-N6)-dimethylallyltransferase MiaA [Clostridiales Family XIII bacterium]
MEKQKPAEKAIVVMGPTAVGKSEFAADIAERYGGEIVSADSMQIYRDMDVGTAKPSAALLSRVPHHLIGFADPGEAFSVAAYRARAAAVIASLFARGKLPVIAGGTGLYIHALLCDMDFSGAGRDRALRENYASAAERFGNGYIYGILKEKDPVAAERIHPNDGRRVIRALERMERGGEADGLRAFERSFAPAGLFTPVPVLLTRDREELYRRIEERVDVLMGTGLADEVRRLRDRGFSRADSAMLGIGYKELFGYLDGDYDLDRAVYLIKLHTRRYAKRQLTWFRRYTDAHVFNLSEYADRKSALDAVFRVTDAALRDQRDAPQQ